MGPKLVESTVMTVEEANLVPEGAYVGKIANVTLRDTEKYGTYYDFAVAIENDADNREITFGCPARLSPFSKLGKLLAVLGFVVEPGRQIDVLSAMNKRISFVVKHEKTPKGTFARVQRDSILLARAS